ncbi:MAG TPA: peptidoglycan DD-metalloendopeptidase family protein [Stellaceae bacterium]|jgi:murein DD-endopeptidase MepM/ murein hydrolase activator NlpD
MTRLGQRAAIIATVALGALTGCTRHGPPAPLSFPDAATQNPGAEAKKPPTPLPFPDVAMENPGAEAEKPPPSLVPQAHLPHPDQIVVEKGDNLYTISRHYDVPLRSIIDANHLDAPFRVAAGTRLDLPQERFHVVQQGDTLYGIARLYGVEVSTLASLNHLSAPYALRSGQTLYLPASVEPPEKPTAVGAETGAAPAAPAPKPEAPAAESASPAAVPPAAPSTTTAAPEAATANAPPRAGRGFAWPVEGRIVEGYGAGPNGTHNDGINIAVRPGAPIRAADGGVVAYAGNELRGYGNLVLIRHSGGYMTAYAHNSQLLVKRGDVVKRGQEIAKAGATGTVDSPQLHFEIRQGARALDPTSLLPSLRASN